MTNRVPDDPPDDTDGDGDDHAGNGNGHTHAHDGNGHAHDHASCDHDHHDDDSEYERALAHAWDLIDEGEVDAAEAALAALPPYDDTDGDEDPDALALAGHIAAARGGFDEALAAFIRAADLAAATPDEAVYAIEAARLVLDLAGDAEAAIALCERALEHVTDDDVFAAAIVIKADAMLELEVPEDEVRALLGELDGCALTLSPLACRAGELCAAVGELDRAQRSFRDALAADDEYADAHHGLGVVLYLRGSHEGAVAAWLRARELDLAEPPPPWHISTDEFERIAEAALAELPDEVRSRLENVPVLIDDVPSVELVESGLDSRLLGLFSGTPLPEKSHAAGQVPIIDTIHLFQRNLERACEDADELAEQIRITVIHETAHFFGLEDDDLDELGLG